MQSSGGSKFTKLDDQSILVGGANPGKDIYQIHARTDQTGLTAVRLQALTHASLPGGGPGRHTNSNFVLSEFELTVVSAKNPQHSQVVKFSQATAEYSQANYGIEKAIDGTTTNNNGWAVDGPTRKKPVTAIFVAAVPFGYEGGSELQFRLRHEASFGTHGVGRARISVSSAPPASLRFDGPPSDVVRIASLVATKRSTEEQAKLTSYYVAHFGKHKALREQISNLEKKKATSFPATMVMRELAKPRATHILFRGEYDKPREAVSPGTPKILPAFPVGAPRNRLGLAQWLVSPDHPLTSRVTVNRLWQQIFGIGLVKTAEDLGTQGEWPSHPELLDWLAVEFIESGWDVKALLKQILLSATYRQTSIATPQLLQRDPQNRLLARGARFRLDAEVIRDSILLAGGLLHEQLGGPSVFPYHPKGLWQEINNRPNLSRTYKQDTGNKLYRRSLYTFWKRTVPPPTMAAFDAPEREYCVVRRARTNTPLQALVMLHDPQSIEAARGLATRIMTEASDDIAEQISLGFRISLARKPNTEELQVLIPFYSQQLAEFRKTPQSAVRLLAIGESIPGANLDSAELAAWTTVARVLLNLSEFVTKE